MAKNNRRPGEGRGPDLFSSKRNLFIKAMKTWIPASAGMTLIIDVGGSKTRFYLQKTSRRTKIQEIKSHPKKLVSQIRSVLSKAKDLELVKVGMRGVWTPEQRSTWRKKLLPLFPKIKVMSDVELAYDLAFGKKPGILINAGTGSIAYGQSKSGKWSRAGGLGPIIGDEGSAFWIGREALKMKYENKHKLLKIRNFKNKPNILYKISAHSMNILKFPKKKQNKALIEQAHVHLLNLVIEIKRLLQFRSPTVFLSGSLFKSKVFRDGFILKLRKEKIRSIRF